MNTIRAAFHTLGCKTNHYETDAIRQQFCQAGFEETPFDAWADVYLVNTCTVTGEAGRKSRQLLRRARKTNPQAIVVALGCHAELTDDSDCADITIGTSGKNQALARVCAELRRRGFTLPENCTATDIHAGSEDASVFEELGPVSRQSETRAQIKIEDGCNNFCSYCTIPLARGRVRSRPEANILREAQELADAGFKEIVLTGIHVCSYGSDQGQPSHAVMELALELAEIAGIERIRLGSLEPLSLTDQFIDLASRNPKLLPHFHLSLQSGCDSVLARMNRRYRTAEYRAVAASLRQAFDRPGLTTDVIVGFPGETAEEHAASLEFCREIGFSRLHVFRYSRRAGTRAADRPDQVAPQWINVRSQEMLRLAGQLALEYHLAQVGRDQLVLLEQLRADGYFDGYTPEYVPVRLPAAPDLHAGQIVRVTGESAGPEFLLCHNAKSSRS